RSRPGCVATRSLSPLSNRLRHSAGTASGFSRYSSSRSRSYPELRPSTSVMNVHFCSTSGTPGAASASVERMGGYDRDHHRGHEARGGEEDGEGGETAVPAADARRDEREDERERDDADRAVGEREGAGEDRDGGEEAGDRVARLVALDRLGGLVAHPTGVAVRRRRTRA